MTPRVAACTIALVIALGAYAGAVCRDWAASGRFADIDAAAVVFEGVVVRIDEDVTSECAPDRVVFTVSHVWKGKQQPEYVLLQTTARQHKVVIDGHETVAGCPMWIEQDTFEAGRPYIVFASGQPGKLESMGCGLSQAPTPATRRRLDEWSAKTKSRESRGGPTRS
jgi:hypothetical protein